MNPKSLLGVGLLIFVAIGFSGCETTAQSRAPLGPNEARVTGHKSALTYSVLITPASRLQDWKNELIIPAGPNRLALRYHELLNGGAIGGAFEALTVGEVAFEAEAGHEYSAEMWGKTIFNRGYKITDKATGKVVGQAKVKDQKKSEKDHAKPVN